MKETYYNNRPLLGGLVATAAIASVLSPASYNSSPANAENIQTVKEATTQALGTWAVSYSCQTDIFSVSAQSPAASHYEVYISSLNNNQSAKVREFDITTEPNIDMQIPMSEAEAMGVSEDSLTSIEVVDTLDAGNVVTGTVVDTVGCPREPEPTPTITITPTPEPTQSISPNPSPTTTIPVGEQKITQNVKMLKKKYRVGKKIKTPMKSKTGYPLAWDALPSRNKKNKKVCQDKTKIIRYDNYRPIYRTKIKTLNPGKCRYTVYSAGWLNEEILFKKSKFKVVKKIKKN
jgi:hypothetical protein